MTCKEAIIRYIIWNICVFLAIAAASCNLIKPNCASLHTGSFIQHAKFGNRTISITRNDSLQIEKDIPSGTTTTNKITWITPCIYTLTPILPVGASPDSTDRFFQAHPFKINIIEVKKSFYIFNTEVDSANFKTVIMQDTIFIQR
jgi:hypothetical protein